MSYLKPNKTRPETNINECYSFYGGGRGMCYITYFMSLNGNLVVINNQLMYSSPYDCSVIFKK